MKSQQFTTVQLQKPNRNYFDLSHSVQMSGKLGYLMPCLVEEVIPGDKFKIGCEVLARVAPLIAPNMGRFDLYVHYFFSPNRLVWENWENMIGGEEPQPVVPVVRYNTTTPVGTQRFLDYMGAPPANNVGTNIDINGFALAHYQKIYNDYYRDENLIPEVDYQLSDGLNTLADFAVLRRRAFMKDYFTGALPWAQKGTAVSIPLGEITLESDWYTDPKKWPTWKDFEMENTQGPLSTVTAAAPSGGRTMVNEGEPEELTVAYDPAGSLVTTPTTLNDLRTAMRLQEMLERDALGGTRYTEVIWAHFGVRSDDARLQRSEYITGIRTPIIISEVLNTTGPTGVSDLPQGNMAGHGVGYAAGYNGEYYAKEHGYIIGILSIMPRPVYQQGVPRHFLKNDRYDWFWPKLAHLGEQPVQNIELYCGTPSDGSVFGYVPRYAEYRYHADRVAGDFRTTGLNTWTNARIFGELPTLSQEFIECNWEDFQRMFAVQDGTDNFWMLVQHKLDAVRPIPLFGTPRF